MDWLPWIVAVGALVATVLVLVYRGGLHERNNHEQAKQRQEQLEQDRTDFENAQRSWRAQQREEQAHLEREREELETSRQRIAGLSQEEARREIIDGIVKEAKLRAVQEARIIKRDARLHAHSIAQRTIVTAIEQIAAEQTAETVVRVIPLPSEEMKGRIIGKEGRNIRAFEQATGTNLLIDDAQSVTISCFDPERRQTARIALEALIADGNIHPARVEHEVVKAKRRITQHMRDAAETALGQVGIADLDPVLVSHLGKLTFRTSYGQNVLNHLVECAHLAGAMASELGLDVARCKRAAFLHDIGKSLTCEREGSHALLGAELLHMHGEDDDIVHAVAAHHNEIEPETPVALLTQAADAISGSRPGARRESLEAYLERMYSLERIATAKPGVAKAYAMQSGHEVRVLVRPEDVDDAAAELLAYDIAKDIEDELTYPGLINVTVVRESRTTVTAH